MNKQELISAIAEQTGQTKKATGEFMAAFADQLKAAAYKGEEVQILGLFSMKTTKKAARTGRNPQTGEPQEISARTAVSFKAYKDLKDAANGK
jgi:DNA-binding protein HU-beta